MEIKIGARTFGENNPSYFIADIAANHDGSLERAKSLISLAKNAGADAAKFQHHDVRHYVSRRGFEDLGGQFSHQAKWGKPVFEVYREAEVPRTWTEELKKYCDKAGIDFFSTPYDLSMVNHLNPYVPAFKIGSGDINWPDMLEKVAGKGKPVFLGTGASTIEEVENAVSIITKINKNLVLMQCNTNYTGSEDNFDYINLRVLENYRERFPSLILGLSDHTPGHATVLGAVALGARVIEKHFTDDRTRKGPDHPFSMDPSSWEEMVKRTRELERALGYKTKGVEDNESQTIILQRRCIRAGRYIPKGSVIVERDLEFQRPAPIGSLSPDKKADVLGKTALEHILKEEIIDLRKLE